MQLLQKMKNKNFKERPSCKDILREKDKWTLDISRRKNKSNILKMFEQESFVYKFLEIKLRN
jgi:hypothetical protein